VKKKYFVSPDDKKDWIYFTKHIGDIKAKEIDFLEQNTRQNKIPKLDLHGYSLSEANIIVEKFVTESFNTGCKKILIITGKGSRSRSHANPYISEKLSVLKYSVPEYIKNNKNLNRKVIKISNAGLKDKGDGSIYIFLKNNKKIKE
tara:strand:+ start:250 stop:687 length:438 start_codon:yes stop_codon:yes gene_type:complete